MSGRRWRAKATGKMLVRRDRRLYPLTPDVAATATSLWAAFVAECMEEAAHEGDETTSG